MTTLRVAGGGHCGFYDAGATESMAVRAIGVTRVGATATRAILDECRAKL